MANQTLEDAYNYVTRDNLQWRRNSDRWQFYLESYLGGDEYRRGNHLTRYVLETDGEYQARLARTPLDNHCRSTIQTYISFLFREPPDREFPNWASDPAVEDFMADADLEGRDIDTFMKEAATWAAVFGHCFIIMTKPQVPADTLADQLAQGVRPYVNILTPLVVTDWRWERQINGRYELAYFKYIEDVNDTVVTVREWDREVIRTWVYDNSSRDVEMTNEEINELGMIPVVTVYNQRSQVRGIGISAIADIADQQRAIYNELSEVEQSIRLEGHPSLVATPDTQVGSGAGALILMPESLDPGLRPYMLDISGTPVDMIYKSIQNRVESIDKMANTGSVRATEVRQMSGVAMETEFQLLNARLSEMADNIELAEEQMWRLWAAYQGTDYQGRIEYPDSFSIRDTGREFQQLQTARNTATDPAVLSVIDYQLLHLLGKEPEKYLTSTAGLPTSYVASSDPRVPEGQQCSNCEYYDQFGGSCIKWDQPVNPVFWCRSWNNR